jgi:thiol-disulfide isomerase/thioredoxin
VIRIKYLTIFLLTVYFNYGICQDKVDLPAPNFKAKTYEGKNISLSDYKGKVILIDFWASWCPPCREEMPELIKFYKAHSNSKFELIAVNIDSKQDNMQHFLNQLFPKPGFPIIMDSNQQIPPLFNIEAMPTTIFVDTKGNIRFRHDGFKLSYIDDFNKELSQLLKEN